MTDLFDKRKTDYEIANRKLEKYCLNQLSYLGRTSNTKKKKEIKELLKRARANLIPYQKNVRQKSFLERLTENQKKFFSFIK